MDQLLKCSLYAVMDGHGGDWCAQFLHNEMVSFLLKLMLKEMQEGSLESTPITTIIKNTFFSLYKLIDKEFYRRNREASKMCGSVASTCMMLGNMLYCINLGDCRSVLCRNGLAINLSIDHKATLKSEIMRVEAQGGYVTNGRVFGRLMITRAFGDFELKHEQDMDLKVREVNYVSIEPEIRCIKVNFETDSFLVLASDGLFDKLTSQEACDFISRELKAQPEGYQDMNTIALKLADEVVNN